MKTIKIVNQSGWDLKEVDFVFISKTETRIHFLDGNTVTYEMKETNRTF